VRRIGAVMHALHAGHGWSSERIAREFDVNWRTARRYATGEAAVGYPDRNRPAELTEAQLLHVRRRLAVCSELRATTLYREVTELGYTGSCGSHWVPGDGCALGHWAHSERHRWIAGHGCAGKRDRRFFLCGVGIEDVDPTTRA